MANNEFVLYEWPGVNFPDMAKPVQNIDGRISILEERSNWHGKIGWGVAGLLGSAILLLVTWWIPHELNSSQDAIKADTATQLEPIKLDMARINALLQLKETKSVSEAIRLGVDFSKPKFAIEAVRAIAQQAKADGILTEPVVLIKANEQLKESAKGFPDLLDNAWSARLSLADYRTSLPLETTSGGKPRPAITFNGPTVEGSSITNGRQKLDGFYWKDVTFIGDDIEYDGGPMVLENVKFVNCTFQMKYNIHSDKLDNMLLAQNPITGSFS
jgi:hypothetical protein